MRPPIGSDAIVYLLSGLSAESGEVLCVGARDIPSMHPWRSLQHPRLGAGVAKQKMRKRTWILFFERGRILSGAVEHELQRFSRLVSWSTQWYWFCSPQGWQSDARADLRSTRRRKARIRDPAQLKARGRCTGGLQRRPLLGSRIFSLGCLREMARPRTRESSSPTDTGIRKRQSIGSRYGEPLGLALGLQMCRHERCLGSSGSRRVSGAVPEGA